ncbi:MAG TPA: type II toxin-antitoxin system VapC family toxin [Alphaproteobacteria bacterium]
MIGLDTNVIVRYLVHDDAAQARRARAVLESYCSDESPGFISLLVLTEICWVLRGAYRYNRSSIASVIDAFLRTTQLRLEDESTVAAALSLYRTSEADFADCLIGLIGRNTGCDTTVTFDAAAASLGEFTAL